MTEHILGMHWMRYHGNDREDFPHIQAMNYKSIKLFEWMWSNKDFCEGLLNVVSPETIFLLRDHPMSEQKEDFYHRPIETGIRHADEWHQKVINGQVHIPLDRAYFLSINEPDSNNYREAIRDGNVAWLDRLRHYNYLGGALNLGTGHPRTIDGTPFSDPDWEFYNPVKDAILRGNHILVDHIYGATKVPLVSGHYNRLSYCNWKDVTVVLGEAGIDEHVITGGNHDGYLITMKELYYQYPVWIDTFIMGIQNTLGPNNPKLHSVELYSYDFSHPWDSFDVRPIRHELETYQWQHATSVITPPEPHTRVVWPVNGVITQFFSTTHNGVDIASSLGSPVQALAHGDVAYVSYDSAYGNYIRLWHPELQLHSFYAHLKDSLVAPGDKVYAGDMIATVGSTGNSTGPHLHFEIRIANKNGVYQDTLFGKGNGRIDPLSSFYTLERLV